MNRTRNSRKPAGSQPRSNGHGDDSARRRTNLLESTNGNELQAFGTVRPMPIALDEGTCQASVKVLNPMLADTLTLRDMYKKHHWQVSGVTFYQLHLLFDKHFEEQVELADLLAERVQMLGGVSIAMAHDVAEATRIERPPKGRESPAVQIARLLRAHETILENAHDAAHEADERGDDGTNDLLVSNVIRTNEMQAWFLKEHLMQVALTPEGASSRE